MRDNCNAPKGAPTGCDTVLPTRLRWQIRLAQSLSCNRIFVCTGSKQGMWGTSQAHLHASTTQLPGADSSALPRLPLHPIPHVCAAPSCLPSAPPVCTTPHRLRVAPLVCAPHHLFARCAPAGHLRCHQPRRGQGPCPCCARPQQSDALPGPTLKAAAATHSVTGPWQQSTQGGRPAGRTISSRAPLALPTAIPGAAAGGAAHPEAAAPAAAAGPRQAAASTSAAAAGPRGVATPQQPAGAAAGQGAAGGGE